MVFPVTKHSVFCHQDSDLLAEKANWVLPRIDIASVQYKLILVIAILTTVSGIVYSSAHLGTINRRDRIILPDVQQISSVVPENIIVGSAI